MGSLAGSHSDRWSDIDLLFATPAPLDDVIRHWTEVLYREFGAVHHWAMTAGATIYRVFLLPDLLEVDLGFVPADQFRPMGPHWRLVFGSAATAAPPPRPDPADTAGLAWHHLLHARACIERGRFWQAEHWLSATRVLILALACLRLDLPASHAKGAHLLPPETTAGLAPTLVRTLDEPELRRALSATAAAVLAELALSAPSLAARLTPAILPMTTPP